MAHNIIITTRKNIKWGPSIKTFVENNVGCSIRKKAADKAKVLAKAYIMNTNIY